MSLPPRLPPECIQLIAEHLHHRYEYNALCSLLRTSKSMFALIAPFAFGHPIYHVKSPGAKLFRTLLQRRSVRQLPRVLQIAYFPEFSPETPPDDHCRTGQPSSARATSTVSVDYSSYIKHLHIDSMWFRYGSPFSDQVQELFVEYSTPLLVECPRQLVRSTQRYEDHGRLFVSHLQVALTWALCEPILEQIQSIKIPLSDIGRYLSVVHRFLSLTSVTFDIDLYNVRETDYIPKDIQDYRRAIFDCMIRFVKKHVRLFGNQLRGAKCPCQLTIWSRIDCPEPVLHQLAQMLPPLDRPRLLNDANWMQFQEHTELTCLDKVEEIQTPNGRQCPLSLEAILPRCRSLKQLDLHIFSHPVTFRWAIEEKIRHGLEHGMRPVSLKSIRITHLADGAAQDIDEIAIAFTDTLEEIVYNYAYVNENSDEQSWDPVLRSFVAGYLWPRMPVLKHVFIDVDVHSLTLNPDLLTLCPALQSLTISDGRQNCDYDWVQVWRMPFRLPELTRVKLRDWNR